MKKLLSLLVVTTLMLCLLSTAAYAQAAIIFAGESGDGVTSSNVTGSVSDTTATIIDSNGQIISNGLTGGVTAPTGDVSVTKSPTSETVEKGGRASFVAHAANSAGITWRLVSSDGLETINAAAATQYFEGVEVYGIGTDTLTLANIPDSMNGWQVEAKFDGNNGPVYTYGARITVVGSSANGTTTDKNPNGRVVAGVTGSGSALSISTQPTGAELTSGKSTTLSVTAGTNDGGTLHYQWYVSTSDDNTAGQAIAGATSASYTPGELPGTRYYYVGVWSEKDGAKSDTVYSDTAAVVYSGAAATPEPSATPSASTGSNSGNGSSANPTNTGSNGSTSSTNGNTTSSTNQPIVPDPNDPNAQQTDTDGQTAVEPSPVPSETENRSSLPVVLGAIAAVALAAGVGLLVLRRNAGQ